MNVDSSKGRARGTLRSQTKIAGYLGALLIACAMAASSGGLRAQSEDQPAPSMVPPPDPGYSLYYHDSEASPDFADRWGYHDGWTDGRHDRNHGDTFEAGGQRTTSSFLRTRRASGHHARSVCEELPFFLSARLPARVASLDAKVWRGEWPGLARRTAADGAIARRAVPTGILGRAGCVEAVRSKAWL